MRANALAWCPTFPTSLLLASEDHNLYTFDIRTLSSPTQIYKGHVAAVMSCDWSGTGTEFVSGGWDRTVRIWNKDSGSRPEVYHTKRMQRVSSTLFSADARFVLSGSDDGNVRIWKAHAAEKLGVVTARERAAIEYRESLKKRWAVDNTVGKVLRFVFFIISVSLEDDRNSNLYRQNTPPPKASASSVNAQAHYAGRETCKRRSSPRAHEVGGEQTESGEEESCIGRTNITRLCMYICQSCCVRY